jgi:phosphate uptake regulator/tRNA A-37 threonylcarbamoyl transferase component Bud32
METLKAIEQNFKLMILEVTKQLEDTVKLLESPSKSLADKVRVRDDYIDNMKNIIENKNSSYVSSKQGIDKKTLNNVWALNTVAHNLEHIADLAVNIADQTGYFTDPGCIKRYDYQKFFKRILDSLAMTHKALFTGNINQALKICRAEFEIDGLYADELKHVINELKFSRDAGNLITVIFIFQCAERIGDSLLNIGEAIISSVMGERMKIHQYQALEDTITDEEEKNRVSEFSLESVGETRSGSLIRKVYEPGRDGASAKWVVFKEGKPSKLEKEKENIEAWEKIQPGLPPKVFGYQVNGRSASIMLQYLSGSNMKDVVINEKQAVLKDGMGLLTSTLDKMWSKTMKKQPVRAGYLDQLAVRMEDVFIAHPEFMVHEHKIGGLELPSFEQMVKKAGAIDRTLEAPFSIFIHGDFNVDNIIFNREENRINFIDLHRSSHNDYVQDVSVFIVSNFRMPFFEPSIRRRLNSVINDFFQFASGFARRNNDATFEARLAMGLIRSFITSTRFEFNQDFANVMFLRAVYLIEKVMAHEGKPWEEFELHREILTY